MNCSETKLYFNTYVENLNLPDDSKLEIIFRENTVVRSCMKYLFTDNEFKGQLISAFPGSYRLNHIEGVFNHEIGTHYLRKLNDMK